MQLHADPDCMAWSTALLQLPGMSGLEWSATFGMSGAKQILGGGEVQSPLNQKMNSKRLRAVDFTLRFILSIKYKFKIHNFNNYTNLNAKSTVLESFELNF
jgi:hypothetical protein